MHRFYKILFITFLFVTLNLSAFAQKSWRLNLGGYIHYNQLVLFDSLKSPKADLINFAHFRLNADLYFKNWFRFHISQRTRLFYGNFVSQNNLAAQLTSYNLDGFGTLSTNFWDKGFSVLNSQIDRLFLNINLGNFDLTVGRQKIDWGKTLFWHPNNIFNTASFFQIDYPEQSGCDAIDLNYSWGLSSSIEAAVSLVDTVGKNKYTAALKYATTIGTYDIQAFVGLYQSNFYTLGLGWSGYIKNLTFRGEFTYLTAKDSVFKTNLALLATGLDYNVGKLIVSTEFLMKAGDKQFFQNNYMLYDRFFNNKMGIQALGLGKYNFLVQSSYQLTPLITISLAMMKSLKQQSLLFMPNISFSLSENTSLQIAGYMGNITVPVPTFVSPSGKKKVNFNGLYLNLSYSF